MQVVVLMTLVVVTSMTYLTSLNWLPSFMKFVPEFLSGIVAVYVLFAGVRSRFSLVRPAYWTVFGITGLIVVCGIIANGVGSGPIVAGLRYLLRPMPFFLLPAVFVFNDKHLRQQLLLLLGIALLQLPISVSQRLTQLHESHNTGDFIFGTLMLSSTLTMFLISAICVALAMLLRGRITKVTFATLFVLFIIPTAINETKITVFILPLSLMIVVFVAAARGTRLRMLGFAMAMLAIAGAIFVPLYDYFGSQNVNKGEAYSISDMFTKKDYFQKYLDQGTDVGTSKEVGRLDALQVPMRIVSDDPVRFAFGYGLGNASLSSLGSSFIGQYGPALWMFSSGTTFGNLILEIGVGGFVCALLLHLLILTDALRVAVLDPGLQGVFASAWCAVVMLMTINLFYAPAILFESLTYLFWFYSGVIASRRMQFALGASKNNSYLSP